MSVTWSCGCGKRTFLHHEWCGSCGNPRPRPPVPTPSKLPSVFDDLKKDATTFELIPYKPVGDWWRFFQKLAGAADATARDVTGLNGDLT